QLILWRVLQGVGAAAITSTAFSIPADLFAPAQRSRYMGLFGATFGLASVIGPWLGGLLTDHLSWHWVFYVNLPLGAVAMAFILGPHAAPGRARGRAARSAGDRAHDRHRGDAAARPLARSADPGRRDRARTVAAGARRHRRVPLRARRTPRGAPGRALVPVP